jgi:hypothetical protein
MDERKAEQDEKQAGLEIKEVDIAAAEDEFDEDQPLKLDDKKVEEELIEPPKKTNKKEPVFPKLFEVAEHNKLIQWSFLKCVVYFVCGILALTVMMMPGFFLPCNSSTFAIVGTICLRPNATYTCYDMNSIPCSSLCPSPFVCQVPSNPVAPYSLINPNPALVVCATMNTYTSLCVDSRTCPASDQNKIFIAYLVLVIVFMLHALFELLYAIFAAKMSEYTEEDFDLNAGFSQSISVAIVKMVPLLSLLVHLALLGAIAFARTVNTSSVVTCSAALTTQGSLSNVANSATNYWYLFVVVWAGFFLVGFNIRQRFSLNEWLYSPAEEITRNGNVIDWDCPTLRYRRDPTEPSFFKRVVVQGIGYNISKCIINCSGLIYFMISQRKNLSA